ncbi:MAG: heterodisulfide reductase-related iron-sulfur binding cluster [Patescibacteria group bacterium]|nr:heterodisulfide reductase-related iron-sulfur binding cluster [Patescibacteria group bacterium]
MTTERNNINLTDSPINLLLQPEEYLDCIHCGLCLSSCPTFSELGLEMDSPRGRIYLMRANAENRLGISENFVKHIDLCLGCRACETACPSTVHYGKMLENARWRINSATKKSTLERHAYHIVFDELIPKHKNLGLLFGFLWWYQKSGIEWLMKNTPLRSLLPKRFRNMVSLLPPLPSPHMRSLLKEVMPAEGEVRHKVGLLRGCIADYMFSHVNLATARVLQKNGCEIIIPSDQKCCGSLHLHSGYIREGKDLARRNIEVFEKAGVEAIIVNSAGCGAAMKEYDQLFVDDPLFAERAKVFSSKVKDITEYLVEIDAMPAQSPLNKRVVYHDACHLAHGQKIRTQPRDVLKRLTGVEVIPLNESEFCCGSAGTYNILHPEMSNRLLERKTKNIIAANGDMVATGNPGCLIQIQAGLRQQRNNIPVVHTIELLDIAYRNGEKG